MSLEDASRTLYDHVNSSHEPLPLLPKPNKFEGRPQCQKPSYATATCQRPLLAKLQTHQSIYARKVQPTAPSNPNPTSRPTPSTYSPHPLQSSSPCGSPWLPSAYPRSPAEPYYDILPDDLSSQNTAHSTPPWRCSRQGGRVPYEPMDRTFCPIHHSNRPCWSCDRVHNCDANEELKFTF